MLLDPEGESPRFDDGTPITTVSCHAPGRESRAKWLEREILPHDKDIRRRLARRFPSADLDDVIQAAYLRLMATPCLHHVRDGRSYFYRAATSEIRDQARRDQIRGRCSVDYGKIDEDTLAADGPELEDVLDSRHALAQFYAELRQMPLRERAVIEMRKIEGLCVRETAARIGSSVSSVEKLQLKAMRRLGAALSWS